MNKNYVITEQEREDIQRALEIASKYMRQLNSVTESDWHSIAKAELAVDLNWLVFTKRGG